MKKRIVKKQKILLPAWLIDVFDEQGVDTSSYIIDGSKPYTDEPLELQHMGVPPPDTEIPTAIPESVARSPCAPTDTELIESSLNTTVDATELTVTEPEKSEPRLPIKLIKGGLDPPRRFTNCGLDPPKKTKYNRGFVMLENAFRCSSGTDPPWKCEVRIRSP